MAIATCAWLERNWKATLAADQQKYFTFVRYLDDILGVTLHGATDPADHSRAQEVVSSFLANCYPKPQISLVQQFDNKYLECAVGTGGHSVLFSHWNKNLPHLRHDTLAQRILRHQHPHSYNPLRQKFGTMIGEFTRIMRNSSTTMRMQTALLEKAFEYKFLGYSTNMLQRACAYMRRKHPLNAGWNLVVACIPLV